MADLETTGICESAELRTMAAGRSRVDSCLENAKRFSFQQKTRRIFMVQLVLPLCSGVARHGVRHNHGKVAEIVGSKTRATCEVAPRQHALALLARLFRYGEIIYHGGFINLAARATSGLRIDPQYGKRARSVNKRTSQLHQSQ
jgi:hypothetical protein